MSVDALKQQILSQGLTGKWSGQGFGSAEANAEDMAKILSGIGITDIRQFGEVTKTVPAVARYTLPGVGSVQKSGDAFYKNVEVDTGDGSYTQRVKLSDAEVENLKTEYGTYKTSYVGSGDNQEYVEEFVPVDPSKIIDKDGVPHVDTGEKTFGNKETGQAVPNTYGERQTGNAFGGTYAGKGNTGYRVQFAEDGTPVFYTTQASSNDLVNLIGDNKLLMVAASVGAAYFGGPAGAAALQAAMGQDISNIAKSAALSYVGGQIASGVSSTQSVIDTLGQVGANIAGNVVGAVATGRDPLAALTTAGLGQTVGESLGMSGTTATTVGSSLVNGVVAELRGKDVSDAMIAGAVSGYFSGEKNIRDLNKAADEDIAGGLIPEYGTNEAYDAFMQNAMTPEAMASIEDQFGLNKPADEDIAGGLDPKYGTNEVYDTFMKDAMTPEAQTSIEDMIINFGTDTTTEDTIAVDTGGFDATEREGSLVKDNETGDGFLSKIFEPMSGADALKTGIRAGLAGAAVAAGGAAVNSLVTRPITTTTSTDGIDIYKDAPIKGYHMKQDPITGRYIPYIGERALLAKGGFVTRR